MRPTARRRTQLIVPTIMALALLGGGTAVAIEVVRRNAAERPATDTSDGPTVPGSSTAPTASAAPASPATASPTPTGYPKTGPGTWRYATAHGAILGTAGPVRHFRVAVETGIPIDVDAFADEVEDTLGDGRSWIAGGQFRLQRVPGNASSEFTVYLATKGTSVKLCQAGGVATGGFTSCRTPGHVVINLDRWVNAVPEYVNAGVPLETYRKYVINHETGHQLGHGHELCPGAGRPAPVMEQQTLGLHGCTANPWPYLDGERYAGPPGHY